MGKILVIAEKPSVARDIANVLGCRQKGNGFIAGDRYIVSWAIGHLVTLCEPEDYDSGLKRWVADSLPIIPSEIRLKALPKTRSQLKILHSLMNSRDTDEIICATDSGREGELIFRYIYEITKCKKSFRRLWISSMTSQAIKEGFASLKQGEEYNNLYSSAKCRSEADWLVGINATRAFTIKYGALLSIGRVQTPTLSIIVDRQKEIAEFVPQTYYEVSATFNGFKGLWFDKKESETRITDIERAEAIAEKVKGHDGILKSVTQEEKRQPPPLLYDLTELQRDCNKKYGYPAQKTLSVAQDLYEKKKMITYPRTDSRYLSSDMHGKIRATLKKLAEAAEYSFIAGAVAADENISIGKRIVDNSKVTDHHAIIPTDVKISLDRLSPEEQRVYNLIAMRFIAAFYPAYITSVTKFVSVVEDESFITKGTSIVQKGWMEVYAALDIFKGKEKAKKEEEILPKLAKGDSVHVKSAKAMKKETTPPPLYTEASLLSAMENAGRFVEDEELKEQLKASGLGTPATRAAIIERLISVGYIVRKGKSLTATDKAEKLISVVPPELKSPMTTGKWEKGLSSIAVGGMEPERFMGSIKRYVGYIVSQASKTPSDVQFEREEIKRGKGKRNPYLGKCPICGKGHVMENSKSFYCTEWRNGCKFTIWKNCLDAYGNSLTKEKMKTLLSGKALENEKASLPQTGESGTCRIALTINGSHAQVNITDFNRNSDVDK